MREGEDGRREVRKRTRLENPEGGGRREGLGKEEEEGGELRGRAPPPIFRGVAQSTQAEIGLWMCETPRPRPS